MIYTEWLGVFFAFSVFLYTLVNIKRKAMRRVLLIIITTSIVSLALTVWQYSQISGFYDFVRVSIEKYLYRSGVAQSAGVNLHYWNIQSWISFTQNYMKGYLPFLVVLYTIVLLCFALVKVRFTKDIFHKNRVEMTALYLCAVPVIMHHIVFFNFTVIHEFSALKTGVFISILSALLYPRLITIFQADGLDKNRALKIKVLNSIIILMVIFSVCIYLAINSPNDTRFKNVGKEIAQLANNNEVVFIKSKSENFSVTPQTVFYAHRNIAKWEGYSKAKELLNLNNVEKGVIFTLNDKNDRTIRIEYTDK
jgi:hypothetical protein